MLTPPDGLTETTIADALATHWSMSVDGLRYAPVGFGSHHWVATDVDGGRWFVTVDDLTMKVGDEEREDEAFARLLDALTVAADLHRIGHAYVVAPDPASDGGVVARIDQRFALARYPFLAGEVGAFGRFRSDADRRAVAHLLGELHATSRESCPTCRREEFVLPDRLALEHAIDDLGATWDAGPFGERARTLLDEHAEAAVDLHRRYDVLVASLRDVDDGWAVTHGEPHGSNVLTTAGGRRLIDWDTATFAPIERDWWHLGDATGDLVDLAAAAGEVLSPARLDLYRMWWDLSEIDGCVAVLRRPHVDTADNRQYLTGLESYLEAGRRWI